MLAIRCRAEHLGGEAGTDGGETIETEYHRPRANQLGEGTHQDSNAWWCPVHHKEPSRQVVDPIVESCACGEKISWSWVGMSLNSTQPKLSPMFQVP
jgi:hypothetical protein